MIFAPMVVSDPTAAPTADFSNDTWWIWVIKAVAIVVMLLLFVLLAIWAERKVLGRMQTRPGPNVHGPAGILQPVGDAVKLLLVSFCAAHGPAPDPAPAFRTALPLCPN